MVSGFWLAHMYLTETISFPYTFEFWIGCVFRGAPAESYTVRLNETPVGTARSKASRRADQLPSSIRFPKSPWESSARSVCDPVLAKSFWEEKLGYTGKT